MLRDGRARGELGEEREGGRGETEIDGVTYAKACDRPVGDPEGENLSEPLPFIFHLRKMGMK